MEKVIVVILSYNLEKYISKAIDSVLKQKTNFNYKIYLSDDCSTDGTTDILKKYKEKYPDKIELFLSKKNAGTLSNTNKVLNKIDCEYFSVLDGDDYWLEDDSLQKQIDFLDTHKDYAIVAGNTFYEKDGNRNNLVLKRNKTNMTYSFDDCIKERIPYFHTSATLFRNVIYSKGLPKCYIEAESTFENCALRGDDFRRIQHLEVGKVYIFDDIFSSYVIHSNGVWQGASKSKQLLEQTISANFMAKYFKGRYNDFFAKKATFNYINMMIQLMIVGGNLFRYKLNTVDNYLFTELLNDIEKNKGLYSIAKPKDFLIKIIRMIK